MTSRRGFFEKLANLAEDPSKLRQSRIAELREWAMECAPLDWDTEQRDETSRMVEEKLSFMTDEMLREDSMKKYVENIVRTKEIFYAARRAELEYLRRNGEEDDNPYRDSYPSD